MVQNQNGILIKRIIRGNIHLSTDIEENITRIE
jgi:hypothetical protein